MTEDLSKYVINVKGKEYLSYKGLLAYAHKNGLLNMWIMESTINADKKTAIIQVKVQIADGLDQVLEFEGLGSSGFDGQDYQGRFVEVAHTRAKARALRDALNINMETLEED
jgi:hypothetical protein